ncbi:restriction endonuclease [Peptococcaceae bacterium CEB3]|nr:restriction endonuclease [Peptococcaceae bacterium CEB3]
MVGIPAIGFSKVFLQTVVVILWYMFRYFWPLWGALVLIGLIKFGVGMYHRAQLKQAGIGDIDKMDGREFELYLVVLFRQLGCAVQPTPYTGDRGADLVLSKDGTKTVVQAKRYAKTVGNKAVQEVVAAKAYYRADKAMVVTNSHFSNAAVELARANDVELWDRNQLVKAILKIQNTKGISKSVAKRL